MNTYDNPYEVFPREHFAVKLIHLHPGNSTLEQRHKSQYVSILEVHTRDRSGNTNVLPDLTLTARCRKGDQPSRAKGREVLRMKAQAAKDALQW